MVEETATRMDNGSRHLENTRDKKYKYLSCMFRQLQDEFERDGLTVNFTKCKYLA